MSGAETNAGGAKAAAASAAPADSSAPSPTAATTAGHAFAPFAAASPKEAALYYHCDEWFLRADTRAALRSFFLSDSGARLSNGAVDLVLCFLQRLTRWALIRTRTLSLARCDSADLSDWGWHSEFGGEDGEWTVTVHDGRRAHLEWWLKRLCPHWLFLDLAAFARQLMEKFEGGDLERQTDLSSVTMWTTLPGSAVPNGRSGGVSARGDRLPAESQLFLGCALDSVAGHVAARTEMAHKSVNVHGHAHGRRYATGQHPHALEFKAEWIEAASYYQCHVCQLWGEVNVYRCPGDSCDFNAHARCFIPRADHEGEQSDKGGNSESSEGCATALDGEPETKRQRVDETGASVGTARASASVPSSSSSSSPAAAEQSAPGGSSAAAPLVWGVAEISAGLSENGLRVLSGRLGLLRELGDAREAEFAADPPQWQWPSEQPHGWLAPRSLEAPFDSEGADESAPLMSKALGRIRDLLQRYAWFHDPAQIAEVKRRFLSGKLAGGHPLWLQRRRVRPVAFYGRSWKPRWTLPDACVQAKVAYHDLSAEEQKKVDEEEGEDEPFGKTSSIGDYTCETVAFDLIDGAGREWPLLLEYRECDYVDDVEAMNAFGSLIDRRDFRTLGLIHSDEEARAALTLQPVDAAPFFRHWTLLSPDALAAATGEEGGDLDPEGSLQPHASASRNAEEQWPDQWLALLHPELAPQQSAPAAATSNGSASQSASSDSSGDSSSAAAIRAHAAAVHTQIQRLVCAAATLIHWRPKDLSMFRAFHPPRVVREFTAAALMQRIEAGHTPVVDKAATASASAAVAAVAAVGNVGGSASPVSAAAASVSHPFAHLPRDLWAIVADYSPHDLPFVALDSRRPVGADPPAAAAAAGSDNDDDDGADPAAGEFVGADGKVHGLIAHAKNYGSLSSLYW